MQNREFENAVKDKMEALKLLPAAAVWDKVEAGLTGKKPRRRIAIIILFALLLLVSVFILFSNQKIKTAHLPVAGINPMPGAAAAAAPPSLSNNKIPAGKTAAFNNTSNQNLTAAVAAPATVYGNKIVTHTPAPPFKTPPGTYILEPAPEKLRHTKSKFSVTSKAPAAAYDTAAASIFFNTTENITPLQNYFNQPVAHEKASSPAALPLLLQPAKSTAANILLPLTKTKNKPVYTYGVLVAAGVAKIQGGFFNQHTVYDMAAFNTVSGAQAQTAAAVNNPATGSTTKVGFWAAKTINEKWRIASGIYYSGLANTVWVGNRVDSLLNVSYQMNKSIATNNYYRLGNTIKYTNRYHLVELPVTVHRKILHKIPLYAEAGGVLGVVVNSNALVYIPASQAYAASPQFYNKLLVSVNMGISADVNAKKKFPFTVGGNVGYNTISAIKTNFSRQHFKQSVLYIKIPLKK